MQFGGMQRATGCLLITRFILKPAFLSFLNLSSTGIRSTPKCSILRVNEQGLILTSDLVRTCHQHNYDLRSAIDNYYKTQLITTYVQRV